MTSSVLNAPHEVKPPGRPLNQTLQLYAPAGFVAQHRAELCVSNTRRRERTFYKTSLLRCPVDVKVNWMSFTSQIRCFISDSYATGVLVKVVAGRHMVGGKEVYVSALLTSQSQRLVQQKYRLTGAFGGLRGLWFIFPGSARLLSPQSRSFSHPISRTISLIKSKRKREEKKHVLNSTADLQTPFWRLKAALVATPPPSVWCVEEESNIESESSSLVSPEDGLAGVAKSKFSDVSS